MNAKCLDFARCWSLVLDFRPVAVMLAACFGAHLATYHPKWWSPSAARPPFPLPYLSKTQTTVVGASGVEECICGRAGIPSLPFGRRVVAVCWAHNLVRTNRLKGGNEWSGLFPQINIPSNGPHKVRSYYFHRERNQQTTPEATAPKE